MTRRIELVNLSNGDGEDYVITRPGETTRILKPGESMNLYGQDVHIDQLDSKEPQPFRNEDGAQVVPYMDLGFR